MFDDAHTVALATLASVDDTISRAAAVAFLAYLLFFPLELSLATVVEVAERKSNLDLDIVAAGLSTLIMATATEKAAEDVKGVVGAAAAALLALL